MDWLINGFLARLGWMLADFASTAAVVAVVIAIFVLPRWWRQRRCEHLRFHETMACDAVCSDCGRNLGFIGSWRERVAQK